jgi:hypothetical protein
MFRSIATRIASPVKIHPRSSSHRRAGGQYTAIRMYAWHSSTDFQPLMSAADASDLAKCIASG